MLETNQYQTSQQPHVLSFNSIIVFLFFYYPPSSAVGTAGTVTWRIHLKRPCCIALGQVLIWVLSPDWFEELKPPQRHLSYAIAILELLQYSRTLGVSNTYHLASCYLNSDKVFLLLSHQYHNPIWGFEPLMGGYVMNSSATFHYVGGWNNAGSSVKLCNLDLLIVIFYSNFYPNIRAKTLKQTFLTLNTLVKKIHL